MPEFSCFNSRTFCSLFSVVTMLLRTACLYCSAQPPERGAGAPFARPKAAVALSAIGSSTTGRPIVGGARRGSLSNRWSPHPGVASVPVNRPVVRMRNNHPSAGAAPCDHCQRLRAYLSPVLRYTMTTTRGSGEHRPSASLVYISAVISFVFELLARLTELRALVLSLEFRRVVNCFASSHI